MGDRQKESFNLPTPKMPDLKAIGAGLGRSSNFASSLAASVAQKVHGELGARLAQMTQLSPVEKEFLKRSGESWEAILNTK